METIHIAIADDHELIISGLKTLLKPYPHINIQGTYTNARQLLEGLSFYQPDVLVLDLLLPDQSGKDITPGITTQYPNIKILILTSIDTPAMVTTMLRRGCKGYLLKGSGSGTLVSAIEAVYRGEEYIEIALREQLLQNVIRYKNQAQDMVIPELTQREKEVLELIAKEYTTKEIAEKLFISYRTAENHRCNLIQKLDVKNTVGLVKVAIQAGLLNNE